MKQLGIKWVLLPFRDFIGERKSERFGETTKRNNLIFKNSVSVGDTSLYADSSTNLKQ